MSKHIRRTVAMIITETWTITWAGGEQISVTYRFRQHGDVIADGLMPPGQRATLAGEEVQETEMPEASE